MKQTQKNFELGHQDLKQQVIYKQKPKQNKKPFISKEKLNGDIKTVHLVTKEFANELKQIRLKLELNQCDFAKRCGVKDCYIKDYENCNNCNVDVKHVQMINSTFNTKLKLPPKTTISNPCLEETQ